jgi:signal transduction histidine kinase
MGHGLYVHGAEEISMTGKLRFTLYFKLFLVFGLTFLGLVQIISDSMIPPYAEEDYSYIIFQIFLCVLLVVANVFAVRYLLRPLSRLSAFSREFSEGHLGPRVELTSNDEIGDLARAMNAMADRIQAQVESLKHMAVGVSHEVRSPLTRMRLAIEMLPEGQTKQILTGQVHELDAITAAILEREALNSGLSDLQKQNFNVGDLLSELAAHYRSAGHEVSVEGASQEICADRRRLEMCLKNLIDNAAHHGAGPINVNYGMEKGAMVFRIENREAGGKVQKGFGLGLLLSESIAKAHGGSLQLLPAAGQMTAILKLSP